MNVCVRLRGQPTSRKPWRRPGVGSGAEDVRAYESESCRRSIIEGGREKCSKESRGRQTGVLAGRQWLRSFCLSVSVRACGKDGGAICSQRHVTRTHNVLWHAGEELCTGVQARVPGGRTAAERRGEGGWGWGSVTDSAQPNARALTTEGWGLPPASHQEHPPQRRLTLTGMRVHHHRREAQSAMSRRSPPPPIHTHSFTHSSRWP